MTMSDNQEPLTQALHRLDQQMGPIDEDFITDGMVEISIYIVTNAFGSQSAEKIANSTRALKIFEKYAMPSRLLQMLMTIQNLRNEIAAMKAADELIRRTQESNASGG